MREIIKILVVYKYIALYSSTIDRMKIVRII